MGGKDSNPLKRLGFKRTNTSGDQPSTTTTELTDWNDEGPSMSKLDAEFAGDVQKHDHSQTVRNLSEVEANERLRKFREDHRFDPNLPDVAEGAIQDATRKHSLKDEALLVDELVEDSPYPEVCSLSWWKYEMTLTPRDRCAPSSATTTRKSRPTRSAPGPLA